MSTRDTLAILIPCLNEELTVAAVVRDFRTTAPSAAIYVIDNGSTDSTAEIARSAGAIVISEPRRGKGRALRSAFNQVDAEVYVLADGDGQVTADAVPELIGPILAGRADMVVGSRKLGTDAESHRVNRIGNRLFSSLLRSLLRARLTDVLSGYRSASRGLLDGLTLTSRGFEIEAELTIKAVQAGFRVAEVPIRVRARPSGDGPRIKVVRDGLRILAAIAVFLLHGRPLRLFGPSAGVLFALAGLSASLGAAPQAIPIALALCGLLSAAIGLMLSQVARRLAQPDDDLRPAPAAPNLP